ncbi:MAG: AAA family ATPase [Alphaproteobacteria bacterium]
MSKIDSKARGTGKRGGILSSFLASPSSRGNGPQDEDTVDGARDRAQLDRDSWPEGMPESANDSESLFPDEHRADDPREKGDPDPADVSPDGEGRDVAVAPDGNTLPSLEDDEVYTRNFSDVANARLWRRTKEARKRAKESPRGFRDVFAPTRPKRRASEFFGRRALIGSIIEAIEEECAHMVLCGETGLGKTSLANVIAEFARDSGYLVARITGTEDLNFGRFIRTLFEELFHQIDETPAGRMLWETLGIQDMNELLQDNAMDLVSEFLGEESLDVTRVIRALDRLSDNQAIVIVDDYDQIKSRELKVRLVQVMKALSDQGGWLSFLIMGRSESPSELLQDDIDSLPNAEGLYVDPLALHEIEEVLHEGAQRVGVQFNNDTVQAIARLSQGVPNVLQWLAFLSVRRAVRRKSEVVEIEDLANIVNDAVTKIDARLRNQYDQACRYEKGSSTADLLYLAVRAPCTPSGLFSAATMHVLSRQIVGRKWKESEIHTALLPLCGKGEKTILRKLDTSEGTFYRFAHPAMRAVVMLKKIVRIPLLSDMRTKDVDAAYLPSPEQAAATSAAAALSHATHAPAQGTAETPQDAVIIDGDTGAPLDDATIDGDATDEDDLAAAVRDAGRFDEDTEDSDPHDADPENVDLESADLENARDGADADDLVDHDAVVEDAEAIEEVVALSEPLDDTVEVEAVSEPDEAEKAESVEADVKPPEKRPSGRRRLWFRNHDDASDVHDEKDATPASDPDAEETARSDGADTDADDLVEPADLQIDDAEDALDHDRSHDDEKDPDHAEWDEVDPGDSRLTDPDGEEPEKEPADAGTKDDDDDSVPKHGADDEVDPDAPGDTELADDAEALGEGDDADSERGEALNFSEFGDDDFADQDEDLPASEPEAAIDAEPEPSTEAQDFPPQPLPVLPSQRAAKKTKKAAMGKKADVAPTADDSDMDVGSEKETDPDYEADPVYGVRDDPLEATLDLSEVEDAIDGDPADARAPDADAHKDSEEGRSEIDDRDLDIADLDWERWADDDTVEPADDPQSQHIADAVTRELASQWGADQDDADEDDLDADETETRRRR